jgi:N utilization substance protein A
MSSDKLFSDLSKVIEQVGKDKGINREIVIDAVKQGMLLAARKKYGTYREIEPQYNEETGEVELFEFKEVVTKEEFIDEEVEITYEEALKLDPEAQLHDSIGIKIEAKDLGRIAAQLAKQIILQKIRDAERENIFNEFETRKGEIASGIARRVEKSSIVVDLGKTEAFLPLREQIPGENFKPGDRIQGYLMEVRQTTKGPQIIMSRADERYLMKLFEIEVPEIYEGVVEIMAAAREPGQRAKIAVRSKDSAVDPVGACVGMKGSRVQSIVQELKGEKIDIVAWNEDITRFACNALAPAEISRVFLDESNHEMEIVVPDNQLSLAIGRKGQNVRLASKLTGWKIDISSDSVASAKSAEAVTNIMMIQGVSDTLAQSLFQHGFGSFLSVSEAGVEDIIGVPGFDDPEKAEKLLKDAQTLVQKYKSQGASVPMPGTGKDGRSDAKSLADLRLKQEMEKLEGQKQKIEVMDEEE